MKEASTAAMRTFSRIDPLSRANRASRGSKVIPSPRMMARAGDKYRKYLAREFVMAVSPVVN